MAEIYDVQLEADLQELEQSAGLAETQPDRLEHYFAYCRILRKAKLLFSYLQSSFESNLAYGADRLIEPTEKVISLALANATELTSQDRLGFQDIQKSLRRHAEELKRIPCAA